MKSTHAVVWRRENYFLLLIQHTHEKRKKINCESFLRKIKKKTRFVSRLEKKDFENNFGTKVKIRYQKLFDSAKKIKISEINYVELHSAFYKILCE